MAEGRKGFLLWAKERPMAYSRAQPSGEKWFLDHQVLTQWICNKLDISMQVGKVQVIEVQPIWSRRTDASLRKSWWDGIHILKGLPVLILWQIMVLEKHVLGIFFYFVT